MIFVVCRYERWCRYWFNEFASRSEVSKVNERNMRIKIVDGKTVQFISEHRFNEFEAKGLVKPDDEVINWDGDDISELEIKIERAA